jgi:hypothetical protein
MEECEGRGARCETVRWGLRAVQRDPK